MIVRLSLILGRPGGKPGELEGFKAKPWQKPCSRDKAALKTYSPMPVKDRPPGTF